ncbi:MAG: agmatinase family protein [Bdellovibrionales bacterium]
MSFNPNDVASADSGIFGLPYTEDEAKLVIVPIPWEATVSYGGGTSRGPELVLQASKQVDLFDLELQNAFEVGYYMEPISHEVDSMNERAKSRAQLVIEAAIHPESHKNKSEINEASEEVNVLGDKLNTWVYEQTKKWLKKDKLVGLLGGDHSTPYGAIRAISEKYKGDFGILHIDAHADLRDAYEGFTWSHASIMFNVMQSDFKPKKLVQIGIRDFCEEEYELIRSRDDIKSYFDTETQRKLLAGKPWAELAEDMISQLPENVYVSFDIDGLDPSLCPNTGTPVPGGLNFHQVLTLLRLLHEKKKRIVGFDLNEVSGGSESIEWNGNIGARILYKLCGWTVITNQLYKPT